MFGLNIERWNLSWCSLVQLSHKKSAVKWTPFLLSVHWLPVAALIQFMSLMLIYSLVKGTAPLTFKLKPYSLYLCFCRIIHTSTLKTPWLCILAKAPFCSGFFLPWLLKLNILDATSRARSLITFLENNQIKTKLQWIYSSMLLAVYLGGVWFLFWWHLINSDRSIWQCTV